MDPSITTALKRAYDFVKQGDKQAAQPLLVDILKKDSENEQAWLLLSLVVDDHKRQVYALRQVARINPSNAKAVERLNRLTGQPGSATSPEITPAPPALEPPAQPKAELPPEFQPFPADDDVARIDLPENIGAPKPAPSRPKKASDFDTDEDLISQRLFGGEAPPPSTAAPSQPAALTSPVSEIDEVADQIFSEFGTAPDAAESFEDDGFADLPGEKPSKPRKERKPIRWRRVLLGTGGVLLLLAFFCLGSMYSAGLISLRGFGQAAPAETSAPEATATLTATATSTPTPLTPTATATPTQAATITPLPSPTIAAAPLTGDALTAAESLRDQINELSGLNLELEAGTPAMISINQARSLATGAVADLDTQTIETIYRYLGLLQDGQSLQNYFLNLGVHPNGGIYDPAHSQIYVVGLGFDEKAQFAYVHQLTPYLIDTQVAPEHIGLTTACDQALQACAAFHALVRGHATLIADDWLDTYANASFTDALDQALSTNRLFPQSSDPAFAVADLDFYEDYGVPFAGAMLARFGSTGVWDVYESPPTTTEQIMHPEKYVAGEEALTVDDQPALAVLTADGWTVRHEDTLGEWLTYLMFAPSALAPDEAATAAALDAAAGWGGDHYYLLASPNGGDTLLSMHWTWDSAEDAQELLTLLDAELSDRFSMGVEEGVAGTTCYRVDTIACYYTEGVDVYLVMGRDQAVVEQLLSEFVAAD